MTLAKTQNAFTQSTMDQIWQRERDVMSMAWKSSESNADRINAILLAQMSKEATVEAVKLQNNMSNAGDIGGALLGWLLG